MNNRTAVFGLLAIALMIVAGIVYLSDMLNARPGDVAPGAAGGGTSSSESSYVPCASCDARHQRLQTDRPGKD